jgi:hypothetical protein
MGGHKLYRIQKGEVIIEYFQTRLRCIHADINVTSNIVLFYSEMITNNEGGMENPSFSILWDDNDEVFKQIMDFFEEKNADLSITPRGLDVIDGMVYVDAATG